MVRPFSRAAAVALLGAFFGAVFLVLEFRRHPDLTFEMDRDLPPETFSGFYHVEVSLDEGFAWTMAQAQVSVDGFDRRREGRCLVRFRGGRPAPIPQPQVTISVDGAPLAVLAATNQYQDALVSLPAREKAGLRLTLTSSPTFNPGPGDPRELGVQVDRLWCRPADVRLMPPSRGIVAAMLAAGTLGATFTLIGLTTAWATGAVFLMAALQAFPLSIGTAPYVAYEDRVVWIAIWIAVPVVLGIRLLEWRRQGRLSPVASFAAAFSAGALYIKLLGLLHPSKEIADAMYHTHRFDYVLAGNYFFTQTMPGGVQFPYAIALYVFAAPWTILTRDHMAVLRIVVASAETVAGLLLFWAILESWRDVVVAACGLLLFHMVPVSYLVLFFANLANGFGQSAAIVTMAAAIVWRLGSRDWPQVLGLAMLAAVAFLSHITTLALLLTTLIATAGFYWLGDRRALADPARSVLVAAVLGLVLATALYYGHPEFLPAYKGALSARSSDVSADTAQREAIRSTSTLAARVADGATLAKNVFGWPIIVLAGVGIWRIKADRRADRLVFALGGWATAFAIFFLFAIAAPARVGRQRYALEFIARAAYAASPAAVVLAALGAAWAWRAGLLSRLAAVAVILYALVDVGRELVRWVR